MRFVIVIREPGSAAQWWPADVSSVQRATNHRCNFISAQAESERLIRLDRAAGQPSVCRVRLSASGVGRQGMARLRIHVGGLAGWPGAWWVESCLAASGSIRRSGSGAPPPPWSSSSATTVTARDVSPRGGDGDATRGEQRVEFEGLTGLGNV